MYGYKHMYTVATPFISVCACKRQERKREKTKKSVPSKNAAKAGTNCLRCE